MINLKLLPLRGYECDSDILVLFHAQKQTLKSLKEEYNEWVLQHNELIDKQGYGDVDIYNNAISTFKFIRAVDCEQF